MQRRLGSICESPSAESRSPRVHQSQAFHRTQGRGLFLLSSLFERSVRARLLRSAFNAARAGQCVLEHVVQSMPRCRISCNAGRSISPQFGFPGRCFAAAVGGCLVLLLIVARVTHQPGSLSAWIGIGIDISGHRQASEILHADLAPATSFMSVGLMRFERDVRVA